MSADDNHILEQIQLISDQLMSAYEYQSVSFYYPYCYEIQSGSGGVDSILWCGTFP